MTTALPDLRSGSDVAGKVAELVGEAAITDGLLHLVAVAHVRDPSAPARVLHIREQTPKSAHDFFLLQVGRARADAIITTGKILREEPDLDYRLAGPGSLPEALHDFRRRLGLERAPRLLVITSGRDFDPDHAAFGEGAIPLIFTSRQGAERIRKRAREKSSSLEVAAVTDPGLACAIVELRRRGLSRITLEAGPSTALSLYQERASHQEPCDDSEVASRAGTPRVDELLLSTFEGEAPSSVIGGPFLEPAELESKMTLIAESRVEEASGPWRFQRWLRR